MDMTDENCRPAAGTNGGEFLVIFCIFMWKTCTAEPLRDAKASLGNNNDSKSALTDANVFNMLQSAYNLQAERKDPVTHVG